MFRACLVGLLLVGAAALAPPVLAQQTAGSIVGTVHDASNAVLPGVTVSMTGETVMGVQTVITDERGAYRLRNIPPGVVDLSFELTGFTSLKRTGVRVAVGAVTEENVKLELATLSDVITVEASSVVVDTQTNRVSTRYGKEWIENAPTQRRSFVDFLAAAPGVDAQAGNQLSSFGSMQDQNMFQLDGINITDTFNSDPTTLVRPNTDVFEEAEILSVGAPAEYGGVQGAVFNVVTRQGSNRFRGSAGYYYQSQNLTGRNTPASADLGLPFNRVRYRDFSGQLGGPIARDRLWFFGAYRRLEDASAIQVSPSLATEFKTDDYFFKPNFRISNAHSVQGTFVYQKVKELRAVPPDFTASTQTGILGTRMAPAAAYTAVLSNTTVVEARYAGFYATDSRGAANPLGERSIGNRFVNRDTGLTSGAIRSWWEWHADRTTVTGKVTHHAADFLRASHDFKFGVQYNDAPANGAYGINDTIFLRQSGGVVTSAYGYQYLPFEYGGTATNVGAFIDDSLQVGDRMTLNLGLRYDHTHTRAFPKPEYDKQFRPTGNSFQGRDYYTWNTVSPRLGVNFKLTPGGRAVLKVHYGRYYAEGNTGSFLTSVPSISPVYFGTFNLSTGLFENLRLSSSSANKVYSADQDPPWTDQYVASLEHELLKDFTVSASFVHKKSRQLPAWIDTGGTYEEIPYVDSAGADATGNSFIVYRLTSPLASRFFEFTTVPDSRSDANVLSLVANKRMSNRWQLTTSSVFTRSTGNKIQGMSSTINWRSFGQNPNDYVNSDGLLRRDRFFMFKAQFLYTRLPGDITVGVSHSLSQGYPRQRTVLVPATNLTAPIQAEPLSDDDRFPWINQLDLRVQKDLRFRSARASLFLDTFNLVNDDAYQSVRSTTGTSANYKLPLGTSYILPRRAMLGAKFTF